MLDTTTDLHDMAMAHASEYSFRYGRNPDYPSVQAGCLDGLRIAQGKVSDALALAWPSWGARDLWTAYEQMLDTCYWIVKRKGLAGAARFSKARELTPEAIADAFANEGFDRFHPPFRAGCLEGVRLALSRIAPAEAP